MKFIKTLKIDINKNNYETIPSVEFDKNARFLHVYLLNNSVPFDLTGCSVKIYAIKADNTEIFNNCNIIDYKKGFIEIELTEQMNAAAGSVECELKIYSVDGVLTTKTFIINISKSITRAASITSTAEYNALTDALNKVQGIDNKIDKIEVEEKFEEFGSQLDTKANEIDLIVERKRIDNLTTLPEGSTTGDAELIDGRLGVDGTSYANIGGAIRGQISDLKSDLTQLDNKVINILDRDSSDTGVTCYSNSSQKLSNTINNSYVNKLSPIIKVEPNKTYVIAGMSNDGYISKLALSSYTLFFGDKDTYYLSSNNFTKGEDYAIFTTPSNAYCLRISIPYRNDSEISVFNTLMLIENDIPIFKQIEYGKSYSMIAYKNEYKKFMGDKIPSSKCKRIVDDGIVFRNLNISAVDSNYAKINKSRITKFSDYSHALYCIAGNTAIFRIKLPQPITSFNNFTMVFKSTNVLNSQCTGNIYFTNDDVYATTYGTWLNGRYAEHNGWINLKLTGEDIESFPSEINYVWVSIDARDTVPTASEYGGFVLDSLIFNQKSIPTVLISLDQVWRETYENGYYDIMSNRNLPVTVLSANWDEVDDDLFNCINNKRLNFGWEMGVYGSYNEDAAFVNNSKDVETIVSEFKNEINALQNRICDKVVSYATRQAVITQYIWSALPHTSLKMVRAYDDRGIGYFDDETYLLPHNDVSDLSSDKIIELIDNAIKYGNAISLFTHGIKTGDTTSIPSSSILLSTWKDVCDYLVEKVNNNELQVLTFREFYNSCVSQ